ncbi:MAG: restriction endonuclease subunit S [Verrucomicrobiota bacterium]
MIANLQPYPQYKQSGSPWLGRMPTHWGLVRLGSVLRERRETNEEKQVTQVLSVLKDVGVIRYEDKGNIGNKKSEDIGRYKIVRPDDIVVNCMNVIIGSVGRSRYTGCLSPVYYVLTRRSEADNPRYLAAIFSTKPFHESLVRIGNGILAHRMRIPMELLKCEPFPVPPPEEQAALVRFLDYTNERLERAIRAKRKVIALLNEQKQSVIHRAVTRGLDPAVPLKTSGIPWLGDIPKHWEVKRIKYLLREVDHRSTSGSEQLLSMRRNHGLVLFAEHFTRPPQAATLVGFKIVRPGQFVVNRMQAGNGVIFASTLTGLVSPDYAVFDPIGDANVEFLGELFRSRKVRAKFRAESKGLGTGSSGFLRLYNDRLGAIHVALPPRQEQSAILQGLAGELSSANTTISRLEREIELLREYRTRLVADVVTGKLDVRGVTLPAESEPSAALGAETIEQDSGEPEEAENPSD